MTISAIWFLAASVSCMKQAPNQIVVVMVSKQNHIPINYDISLYFDLGITRLEEHFASCPPLTGLYPTEWTIFPAVWQKLYPIAAVGQPCGKSCSTFCNSSRPNPRRLISISDCSAYRLIQLFSLCMSLSDSAPSRREANAIVCFFESHLTAELARLNYLIMSFICVF